MIEKTILDYLKASNITGIGNNVFLEVPKSRPNKYIVFEKTGSGRADKLNRATIAVQSISLASLYEAATINEAMKDKMLSMPNTVDVSGVFLDSDYNYTNPETKEYRYQAVFSVYY